MRRFLIFFVILFIFSCSKDKIVDPEPEKEYFNLYVHSKIQEKCYIKIESGDTILEDFIYWGLNYVGQLETNQYTRIEIENWYSYIKYLNTTGECSLYWHIPTFNLWVTNNTTEWVYIYWMWDGNYTYWWQVGLSPPGTSRDFGWWLQYDGNIVFYGDSSGVGYWCWFDTVNTFGKEYYEYIID